MCLGKWDGAPSLGERSPDRGRLVDGEKGISLGEAPGSRPQEPQTFAVSAVGPAVWYQWERQAWPPEFTE